MTVLPTCFSFSFLRWGETCVHLVRRSLIGLLYQPRMIDDECGAVGGMWIGRGNRITRGKPAPLPFCSPQIPYDLTSAWTRAATVVSRRLTAWAMARSLPISMQSYLFSATTPLSRNLSWFSSLLQNAVISGSDYGHNHIISNLSIIRPLFHERLWNFLADHWFKWNCFHTATRLTVFRYDAPQTLAEMEFLVLQFVAGIT
jgi:hypothetical protein